MPIEMPKLGWCKIRQDQYSFLACWLTILSFAFVIVILVITWDHGYSSILHVLPEEHYESIDGEENNFISCTCDNKIKNARIHKNESYSVLNCMQNLDLWGYDEPRTCIWLKECESCDAEFSQCTKHSSTSNIYDCTKKVLKILGRDHFFPSFANRIFPLEKRKARDTTSVSCRHPSGMKHVDLTLTKYPSYVTASAKCIFGYTYEEGISRKMQCKYAEDKWMPKGFEECQPFVDCRISLQSRGFARCATATLTRGTMCNITCDVYEDKPSVSQATYECLIHGGWKPKLPHCATAGSGLDLVKAPSVKVHPDNVLEEDSNEISGLSKRQKFQF